jgi:broad specificity phosphatase PhoE
MGRIYLIRHGKPASTWGQDADPDPGLDEAGKTQAQRVAEMLMSLPPEARPAKVISSPLARCRETAEPTAAALGVEVEVDALVGEIPTPQSLSSAERGGWLRKAFQGKWSEIEGDLDYDEWRRDVAGAVGSRDNAAIFSHYVAINAVVTHLTGQEQVMAFRPDHASVSIFELRNGQLVLVERGPEATTGVL